MHLCALHRDVHRHERVGAFGGLEERVVEGAGVRGVRGLQRAHHPHAADGRQVATFVAGKERLSVEGKRPVAHARQPGPARRSWAARRR